MARTVPETMRAAAIDHFGGVEAIHVETLKVPELGAPRQVRLAFRKTGERSRAAEAFLEVVRNL